MLLGGGLSRQLPIAQTRLYDVREKSPESGLGVATALYMFSLFVWSLQQNWYHCYRVERVSFKWKELLVVNLRLLLEMHYKYPNTQEDLIVHSRAFKIHLAKKDPSSSTSCCWHNWKI